MPTSNVDPYPGRKTITPAALDLKKVYKQYHTIHDMVYQVAVIIQLDESRASTKRIMREKQIVAMRHAISYMVDAICSHTPMMHQYQKQDQTPFTRHKVAQLQTYVKDMRAFMQATESNLIENWQEWIRNIPETWEVQCQPAACPEMEDLDEDESTPAASNQDGSGQLGSNPRIPVKASPEEEASGDSDPVEVNQEDEGSGDADSEQENDDEEVVAHDPGTRVGPKPVVVVVKQTGKTINLVKPSKPVRVEIPAGRGKHAVMVGAKKGGGKPSSSTTVDVAPRLQSRAPSVSTIQPEEDARSMVIELTEEEVFAVSNVPEPVRTWIISADTGDPMKLGSKGPFEHFKTSHGKESNKFTGTHGSASLTFARLQEKLTIYHFAANVSMGDKIELVMELVDGDAKNRVENYGMSPTRYGYFMLWADLYQISSADIQRLHLLQDMIQSTVPADQTYRELGQFVSRVKSLTVQLIPLEDHSAMTRWREAASHIAQFSMT